ncbi:glycosyltransferase family 10 domain-containing protein [Pedobacter sp. AW31-3R]|uniref:glycosyltransferase family 10 domain-containing protein n=1 Tax=Pedobacter sp. AW31-3R TaxID=3445781 RepID=UPI003F9F3D23
MVKIKFFSDYAGSADLLSRFKANYDVYDQQIGYTLNDDYHYAVVFNRAKEQIKPWAKIITVIQEPSWSPAHQIQTFLTNSDYLIIHDPALFEEVYQIKLGGKVIESPSFMFYHDRVDYKMFRFAEQTPKEKKLSIILSGKNYKFRNYSKRIDLLVKILESDLDIDIYGRQFTVDDPRFKGELDFKHKGLFPYEYSIAIENSDEKNYISEKFFDCIICNTTPIYHGAPNIKKVYDERYFRTIDLESPSIIEDIKAIIAAPAPGAGVNKDIYFNTFNLYTKLKDIIYSDL